MQMTLKLHHSNFMQNMTYRNIFNLWTHMVLNLLSLSIKQSNVMLVGTHQ